MAETYEPILDGQKIPRKYLAHFLDAAIPADPKPQPAYVRLGEDLEEYTTSMSATIDKKQNILGGTSVLLSSYEKSGTVEPYYAEKGTPLHNRLRDIADNLRVLDDCNSTLVDVHMWEGDTGSSFPAVCWDVIIEVTGDGGDTTGLQIPFSLHYTGGFKKGTFDVSTKKFAPAT